MIRESQPDRPSLKLIAGVAAGVVLAAWIVAVHFLDLDPWSKQPLQPFLEPETAREWIERTAELEQRLRDTGRSLPAPVSQLLEIAEGRERLFAEASDIEKSGDYVLAATLYRRLARNGHGKSALRLGEFHDRGKPGVPRDLSESLQWYEIARQLGESLALPCAQPCANRAVLERGDKKPDKSAP